MELDLDALPGAEVPVGPPISGFPPVYLDLAFVVGEGVPAIEVDAAIRGSAGPLLEDLRLFDVYAGPQVGEGKKSLAYSLTLRAPDRTLSGEEAATVRGDVVASVESRVGAQLRG
jgi:phenylalanyl-tRNA synthetase beta chain